MRNLPDLDGFGLAGLTTDPYVEVSIGDNVRKSGTIRNSLNPKWPPCSEKACRGKKDIIRDLNFGFRPAGTEIVIKVWDEDSGFEFGDDLIAQITVNAIYCSAFSAREQTLPNDEDSVWRMPSQPLCVEELWIPLVSGGVCMVDGELTATTACMRLRMTSLPFQMKREEVFVTGLTINGGMGGYFENEESWLYGRVYSASGTKMASYFRMERSKGGLLIRSDSTMNNHKGNISLIDTYGFSPLGRVTINYDAEVFVFRRVDDAASQPEWLRTAFGWSETREYAQLMELVGDFQAVAKNMTAHPKNKYADALGGGFITGANLAQNYTDKTLSMYFIVAQPHESFDVIPAVYSKEFSLVQFANILFQFGILFTYLLVMAILYLRRMNWRIERVMSFLAEKVGEGDDPLLGTKALSTTVKQPAPTTTPQAVDKKSLHRGQDIVASLFLCYKQSPDNLDFRRNLFYATLAIYLVLFSPVLILIPWGVTTVVLVTPPSFGFALIFLGLGTMSAIYGLIRWKHMGWRMTKMILNLFGVAFLSAFLFLFCATLADPRVFLGGEKLDFFSVTCIFLTLNMMPMLWIAFTNDSKLAKSFSQVIATVGASKKVNVLKSKFKNLGTIGLKLAAARSEAGHGGVARRTRKESVFAPLMGDHYTVEQSIPGFELADILQNAFVTPPETRQRANRRHYVSALTILALYCIVAVSRTSYPLQALGIAITVILIDLCIYMLSRGNLSWSAGYTVFLMSSIRVCLAGTSGKYWIVGHAFLYMVFGNALCREIIGKNLPRMGKHEAGGVTFFGHEPKAWRHLDLSTTPEFVLGFLSFFYVFLLLAVAFGTDANDTIRVPVAGQEWPLWVFGVLAFIVVIFTGLALATSRAFFLQREQLLSDYAQQVYLFVRPFKLPFMLAAASEILVICSGLFVFASTRSSFILVTSIFGPLMMMLSLAVFSQWQRNDYRLVIWPPEDEEEDILDDDDEFDEEAALEKEAEIMRETFVLPPLKGRSNTTFFDGNDETFKMPALPSKNTLQSKFLQKPKLLGAPAGDASADDDGKAKLLGGIPLGRMGLHGRKKAGKKAGDEAPGRGDNSADVANNAVVLAVNPGGLGPVDDQERSLAALSSLKEHKVRSSRRFAVLRDFFRGRLRFRELFSRQTWRKYQEVSAFDGNVAGLSPPGSARALLASGANSSSRKQSGFGASSAAAGGLAEVDFAQMSLYQAFRQGFLLPQDYVTIGSFGTLLSLIFLYGFILSWTETPHWFGHVIWIGAYVLIFTLFPTVKYFKIADITEDMKHSFAGSYLLAWIAGFILFFAVLGGNVNEVESLVIFSILVFYPIFLLFVVTLFKWKDEDFAITRPVRRIFAFCMGAIVLWIFEMYVFAGVLFGGILTFLLALFLFIVFFVIKWVENDKYLAPQFQRRANMILFVCTKTTVWAGVFSGLQFFFCLSIIFVVLILKFMLHFAKAWLVGREDLAIFYSPYLFPVFSYNAYTNNVVDENRNVRYLYILFLLLFLWGASGVMFFDPLGFGIGLCSLVLLGFAGTTAHLCAITPVKMGLAAKYVNELILQDAGKAAKAIAEQRRKPFSIECAEFVELERREKKAELEFQAIAYGGAFAKQKNKANKPDKDTEAEGEPEAAPRRSGGDIAVEIEALERSCRFQTVDGAEVALPDGLWTPREAVAEILGQGTGPFGFLYGLTLPWRLGQYLRHRYFPSKRDRALAAERAQQSEEEELDALERGVRARTSRRESRTRTVTYPTCTDLVGLLLELPVLDEELDRQFYEETRCIIHLQLLLMHAADARLGREKILFQKFLRENRFKLMSNGINPPANIFRTSSFASIDIPLVAVWLLSLSPEARARFHGLKAAFNEEMERLDAIIDAEDQRARVAQDELRAYWRPHEEQQCRRRLQEFTARRLRREAEGIVPGDAGVTEDEAVVNAHEALLEIESGYSCVPGDCGRALQFVDREFPPDATSVANVSCEGALGGWRVSTAINVVAGLFDGGTDPDDVRQGRLQDAWLLSALSIIAASGGVDDGKVDALIDRLFITKQTSLTGAYAIRLFKNGQWETVIVDDHFPVLATTTDDDDGHSSSNSSAGAAFAHSKDFEELWVPLVEKAVAKYYGGYAALEQGYVHHALKELTSYDSDEIFLAPASRGTLKETLWKQLLAYKANKFLMGAGTIASDNADTEILDTGLVFGACYVVYDVRQVDGHRLLQLRNPPGDHDEWKGDWSDHSRLWTRRLRRRLQQQQQSDGDNTFWMSFDDFCHAFRSLYVCRYYDPVKWPVVLQHGEWRGPTACGLPTRHNPQCVLECNPQFTLQVTRPTEVLLTVTQVDRAGLAPMEILPVAVYVVAAGPRDRAVRVTRLDKEQVIAHSGAPARERELRVQCELPARAYTVLVAAYKRGMEGPFQLRVQTNYPVGVEPLWPAVWKDPSKAATLAGRVLDTVGESSAMGKLKDKKNELLGKLAAGAAVVDNVMRDEETILREELERQRAAEDEAAASTVGGKGGAKSKKDKAAAKSPWIEQWDEQAGKPFYFNRQTGVSSWDKPADL